MNYIKTINKQARQRGTTLIELSVVIAVILLLVGVLFIGVTAWKEGANKAACIVNLSSVQKAVRGYQNMNGLANGDALDVATLTAQKYWAVAPTCPSANAYTYTAVVPAGGVAYVTCAGAGHAPSAANLANW
jgi:prepilin-type N-terminal cleavage/methylation domain-containing protein